MTAHQNHAVELTKGPDYLDIWVDTNNNGVRDDDDVNIFVSSSGNVYAQSASFKATLDAHLKERLKEASMALMERFPGSDPVAEQQICSIALQMIVKATNEAAEAPVSATEHLHVPAMANAEATAPMPAYHSQTVAAIAHHDLGGIQNPWYMAPVHETAGTL